MFKHNTGIWALALSLWFAMGAQAAPEKLKPYILGSSQSGDMAQVVNQTKTALAANGFEVVGSYVPFPEATVIVVTNNDLKAAAAKAKNGGFGVGQRVAVTTVDGKIQVSYVNPAYIGAAYGLGRLESVSAKLQAALGNSLAFGSEEGLSEKQLAPGTYHYKWPCRISIKPIWWAVIPIIKPLWIRWRRTSPRVRAEQRRCIASICPMRSVFSASVSRAAMALPVALKIPTRKSCTSSITVSTVLPPIYRMKLW